MIYHFNSAGIYEDRSAIETAQIHRQKCLDALGVPNMHILGNFPRNHSVYYILTAESFDIDHIIWLYTFFSDIKITKPCISLDDFLATISENDLTLTLEKDNYHIYGTAGAAQYAITLENDCVAICRSSISSDIIRDDYYMDCRYASIFYYKNKPVMCRIYNRDQTIALDEIYDENDDSIAHDNSVYLINGHIAKNRSQVFSMILYQLALTKNDMILVDRMPPEDVCTAKLARQTNIYYIFHSTHKDSYNPYHNIRTGPYGSKFRTHNLVGYITATDKQAEDVRTDITKLYGKDAKCNVWAIPVACVDKILIPDEPRKNHAFIAVGRYVQSKRIDITIRAIAEVRKTIPDVTLDIYGGGKLLPYYHDVIKECGCSDIITVHQWTNLENTYKHYDAFIGATIYEGFSLAYLEAMASGLPVLSFDSAYAGTEHVIDGETGFLTHLETGSDEYDRVHDLADIIRKYCALDSDKIKQMRNNAYNHAKKYYFEEVTEKWRQFLTHNT